MLAARGHIDAAQLVLFVVGLSLVIGSACVVNNVLDRGIDQRMARTRRRATVVGRVSPRTAIIYAVVLAIVGYGLLAVSVNLLTIAIGAFGMIDYLVFYTWGKRHSVHGTLIGSLSGAAPMVAGYTVITARFDAGAWILLAIMIAWQMAHFFAIAIYRQDDYAAAGLPVLPVAHGVLVAKRQIMVYTVVFGVAVAWLGVAGYAGYVYRVGAVALAAWWLTIAVRGWRTTDDVAWAKAMFRWSLIVITGLSVLLAVGSVLP